MNTTKNKIILKTFAIFSLIFLSSCRDNETNKTNEDPKALQEESINLGRFRSNNNLVDDLYQELVTKSPKLKILEKELEDFKIGDSLNIFYNYDEKSNDYYLSATNQANIMKDSVMKHKILNLIESSSKKYVAKKANLEELIKTIHQKQNDINVYHNALKIILTIPLIEKYQDEHLPKNSPFDKIIDRENQLLQKTKSITPKY